MPTPESAAKPVALRLIKDRLAQLAGRSFLPAVALVTATGFAMPPAQVQPWAAPAVRAQASLPPALRRALKTEPNGPVADFYRSSAAQPLWTDGQRLRPSAWRLLSSISRASEDALDPTAYDPQALAKTLRRAKHGDRASLAQIELALSRVAATYLVDLHRPAPGAAMIYADPTLAPQASDAGAVLKTLAGATTPEVGLDTLTRMSPIYERLRAEMAAAERRGDGAEADTLRANLERARGLPADFGPRHLLVDLTGRRLEVWEEGRRVDSMPVVVGKPSQPTPVMAGMLNFLVLNPHWNMPPDLAAERVAPAVLRSGEEALVRRDLEVVSDFTDRARPVAPTAVDWSAVAAGETRVFLRQRPGPDNMMGRVKFIFPNRLGVYLHDTPIRSAFAAPGRLASAGCVRLSDAPRLARRLVGEELQLAGAGAREQRVALPRPVPVYLVYFTRWPTDEGVKRRADVYGLDRLLLSSRAD
jgi:L,D-transpeptidase YcbB